MTVVAVFTVLSGVAVPSRSAINPTAAKIIVGERITKAGIDRANNLWMWNAAENRVTRVSTRGEVVRARVPANAYSVDADAKQGIAVLSKDGSTLTTLDWAGNALFTVVLADPAVDVVWFDSMIAVAPQLGGTRAQVIDLSTGKVTHTLGTATVVPKGVGARPSHAALLRYDWARRELLSFETYAGELEIFSREGTRLQSVRVVHPEAAAVDAWMSGFDAKARAAKDVKTPIVFRYATMSIGADGAVWLGEGTRADQTVGTAIITREGNVARRRVRAVNCPSVRFVEWQNELIFFRDPALTSAPCTNIVAKP